MQKSYTSKDLISLTLDKNTKLGDLRKLAAAIKKDHALAIQLWQSGGFMTRQLSILIMDKKLLQEAAINKLVEDIDSHPQQEKLQLIDWLMANQLMKDKQTIAIIESWVNSNSILKRRVFWYYQGRLRWVGQTPPNNTAQLLELIEARIANEHPDVQWAMNFTAAQVGIFDSSYRSRCIALGEKTGLYKDEVVAKNCTPNYLPKYIAIQVAKLEKTSK